VATCVANGDPVARRWDLDEVVASGEWRLLKVDPLTIIDDAVAPTPKSWTSVVWRNCDRIVTNTDANDAKGQQHFYEIADRVASHLGMTFHRYLGSNLTIRVNGRDVPKWDPFVQGNLATQNLGEELLTYPGGLVSVTPFVLPHRSKLTESEYLQAGGPDGWNSLQGFFVYRNRRLLVAGDWLGLRFTKEEHYKLARIRIDIPNDADDLWQLDVRKSVAVPPPFLRSELQRIAKITREKAVTVYRHRGKVVVKEGANQVHFLWNQRLKGGKIHYEINRDHPAVQAALENPNPKNVKMLITLVEETIPIPLIAINASERNEEHAAPLEFETPKQIVELAIECYESFLRRGEAHADAVRQVLSMDPFHLYPELSEDLDAKEGKNE
jgi:hypothetical protein